MRKLPPLLVLGAAALVGCGGSGPSYVHEGDGALRVTLDEYRITPQEITVPAGRLELVARNDGRLTHNLAVESVDREMGEQRVQFGRTPTAQPGETVRAEVDLRPGTYRLACTLANHDDLGQYGSLKVTAR